MSRDASRRGPRGAEESAWAYIPGERLSRSMMEYVRRTLAMWGDDVANADDIMQAFLLRMHEYGAATIAALDEAQREKYVWASLRNMLRSWRTGKLDREKALRQIEAHLRVSEPSQGGEAAPFDGSISEALSTLDESLAKPTALFLGLGGPPMSIRAIADSTGLSRHVVRRSIIDGVLSIAAELQISGQLTPREAETVRLVFALGYDVDAAATAMGVPPPAAAASIARARATVARSLSRRQVK